MVERTFGAGIFSFWHYLYLAFKERRFAKRISRRLLKSYSAVSVEKLDLSGKALYREVHLHTQQVDSSRADQILLQAEDSMDEWIAPGRARFRFREVVHIFAMLRHQEASHKGIVVSLGEIFDVLVPAQL